MKYLAELQTRLDQAKESLREIEEQKSKHSEDLIGLIEEVEGGVRTKQAELAQNRLEHQRLLSEHDQLKTMLTSLVTSIEGDARDTGDDVLRRIAGHDDIATDPLRDTTDEIEPDAAEVRLGMQRLLRSSRPRANGNGEAEPTN